MAVTFKEEIPGGRSASNDSGKRTYQRQFRLMTSSQTDSAYDVGSHVDLPVIGEQYPDDSSAWCNSIKVENSDPWKGWTVTVGYSSERELATDPTSDPAIIRVSTEQFQREATQDNAGFLICNSAGDPLDPPLMMDDSRRVIHVSKNMSGHPSWILNYADMVNNDTFDVKGVTYGIGKGKIQRVSIGEQQVRNGVPFVVVELEIHLRKDGWFIDRLDQGFRESISGTMSNIRNSGDGELPSAPVPLEDGVAIEQPSPTADILLTFAVYTTGSFASLPLT